jgi:hypothetical protein
MARLEGSLFYFLGDARRTLAVGRPKQCFSAEPIEKYSWQRATDRRQRSEVGGQKTGIKLEN